MHISTYTTTKPQFELLFEKCDVLWELAEQLLPAENEENFIEKVRSRLHSLSILDFRVKLIVAAHPRLGESGGFHSNNEQQSLKTGNVLQDLAILNQQYEQQFDLRYVVFVNGRDFSMIAKDMRARIQENNYALEVCRAFDAMCDIALSRRLLV